MLKRFLLIGMAASIILAGCGGKNTNNQSASGSTTANNESTSENTDQANDTKEENTYENLDFSFESNDIFEGAISDEIYSEADLTMVNIFTTWCPPCIQEIPHLAKINTEYKDKGFQIIGFVTDVRDYTNLEISEEAKQAAVEIYEASEVSYPFIIPDETFMNGILLVQSVPTTVFLDKNGKMVGDPIVGSNSYEGWKEEIDSRLEMVR